MEMAPDATQPPKPQKSVLDRIDGCVVLLSKVSHGIAGLALVGMLLLVLTDIIGIKLLASPVPGGLEYVSFLAVLVIGFALAHTAVVGGHVHVDLVVDRLPKRLAAVVNATTTLLGCVLFILAVWYTWKFADTLRASGEVSMTQKIPFYPFVYALSVCYAVTLLVLLLKLARAIVKVGSTWTQ